jgi:hypothetical protein
VLAFVSVFLVLVCYTILKPATMRAGDNCWAATYGGRSWEEAWSITATSDGGCAVAGWTYSFGAGDDDFWALKLASDGTVQWEKTYGGHGDDAADLIIETSDGGYALTGYTASFGAGGLDVWVLKLTADGSIQWQKTYGGPADDEAVSVQETLDGGYVVAGETQSYGAGDWDIWILKLSASGAIEWQHTYGGRGRETCSADPIVQTLDGGYVVTGHTASFGAGNSDVWVLKLDENGAIQWQKTYGGRGYEEAHAIRQTVDGGYAVAAFTSTFGAGDWDVWVLKLDQSGAVLWQKTFGGQGRDVTWSVHQTADGGCVVTGGTASFGAGGDDAWVLKLDHNGAVDWQKTYGGREDDEGESVRQSPDGGYWVGGGTASFGAGGLDFWVLRLDPQGSVPGCALGVSSDATIRNTSVVGVNSTCTVSESAATVSDTRVSAVSSAATVRVQCVYQPTPTPTVTLTPPPTPTPSYGIYLPMIKKK